jgi:hypothetical protein
LARLAAALGAAFAALTVFLTALFAFAFRVAILARAAVILTVRFARLTAFLAVAFTVPAAPETAPAAVAPADFAFETADFVTADALLAAFCAVSVTI